MPAAAVSRIVVGISGASGAIYAVRTVRALLLSGFEIHLVVSRFGERLLEEEAGVSLAREGLTEMVARAEGNPPGLGRIVRHDEGDLGAPISSGSFRAEGMVVVPCSTRTLSAIASGASTTLMQRAADVCLKERRRLVLVPREAPFSLIHLRNMVAVTEAGAIVIPAAPGFYQKPRTIVDLADFIAGRILNVLGIEQALFRPWGETDREG